MSRWIYFIIALAFVALGLFNAFSAPSWAPWHLAVVANNYGHWLALLPLGLALVTWAARGRRVLRPLITCVASAAAIGLLMKPCVETALLAPALPGELTRAFGPVGVEGEPFSFAGLFARDARPVPVETHAFAPGLELDLYRAERTGGRAPPCVIVIHGGGWDSGDRRQLAGFNPWLARHGYAVASISYRLAPTFTWPAQRDDALAAIAFLKAHAAEFGIDPARLVLFGRSAGGQIAETAGYTAHDPAIRGIVALYAPSDLAFGYAHAWEDDAIKSPHLMRQFLGGTPQSAAANYESASALRFVDGKSPPTLLLHGQLDTLVWYRHSERLDAALAIRGVPHVFISLPWATHAFDYSQAGPGGQILAYSVAWFLAAVTK